MTLDILKVLLTLSFVCYVIFFITKVLMPYIKQDQYEGAKDYFWDENLNNNKNNYFDKD